MIDENEAKEIELINKAIRKIKEEEKEKTSKSFIKSKTVIFNAVVIILPIVEINIHFFGDAFSSQYAFGIFSTIVGAGNVYLRTITKDKVHIKGKKDV